MLHPMQTFTGKLLTARLSPVCHKQHGSPLGTALLLQNVDFFLLQNLNFYFKMYIKNLVIVSWHARNLA